MSDQENSKNLPGAADQPVPEGSTESEQPRTNQRRSSQPRRAQPTKSTTPVGEESVSVRSGDDEQASGSFGTPKQMSPLPPLEAYIPSAKAAEAEPRRQTQRPRVRREQPTAKQQPQGQDVDDQPPASPVAKEGMPVARESRGRRQPATSGASPAVDSEGAVRNRKSEEVALPSISVDPTASSGVEQTDYLSKSRPVKTSTSGPKVGDVIPADEVERIRARNAQVVQRQSPKPKVEQERKDQAPSGRKRKRYGRTKAERDKLLAQGPVVYSVPDQLADSADSESLYERRANQRVGKQRNGRPVGRYLMCVQVKDDVTQIAVLEGRTLIEHYVSRDSDNQYNIDGNIYLGRVTNVLPGMEAAFVDIGTSKNAVLYRGDVRFERDDIENGDRSVRIEQLLRPKQTVICQVTKNPIGSKGARLTQEVSLPGRFVVLIPNSNSYGISKRLPDDERKRLRRILDDVKPEGFGVIVRTAAEGASNEELTRDVVRLKEIWEKIETRARMAHAPTLLYREPQVALRVIREEFNRNYRGIVINNSDLYEEVVSYVSAISPELANRVEYYDLAEQQIPMFETFHVHEQLHKALERKVWLPSGGSIVIDRAEALTVIDVNTGKNVGTVSLEETIHRNNLEAVEEIARQLRLRDIGGIIVIDFIDMLIKENRDDVMRAFRSALARDKTKTHVYEMSQLGLVEMTRQRVSEGLVEAFSQSCPNCGGRGIIFDQVLL